VGIYIYVHCVVDLVLVLCLLQKEDGNAALHIAVLFFQSISVAILLDAGADATCLNFSLDSPVHLAARNGNLS